MNLDKLYLDKINDTEFVAKFKKFIYSNNMISYSDIKDWLGYKQKRTVIEILENPKFSYINNIDYKIVKEKREGICKPINEIYMTIDTIKCICLTAPTELSQKFRKYYIEMEKIYKEYIENELKNKLTNPIKELEKYTFNINDWLNKKIVYLIHVKDNLYKYGITADPKNRFATHRANLNYNYIIKCWDCNNLSIAKKIEDDIKKYLKCNRLNTIYEKHTEIFTAKSKEELNIIMEKINETYIKYNNSETKNNKEIEKQLIEEDKKFNNREQILIDKYTKNFNLFLTKDIFQEIKNDIKLLLIAEKTNNNNDNDNKDNENNDNININININNNNNDNDNDNNNDDIKCSKCKNTYKNKEMGIKPDGTIYKTCDLCREKCKLIDAKKIRKPLTEEQKQNKYTKRKEKRLLEKLENPKEPSIKQTKEEKLLKKKKYYEENKETIREKYSEKMKDELEKQKERERKVNYYWSNHDKMLETNREYYKRNAIKICKKKKSVKK